MTRISKNNKDEEFSIEEIFSLSTTKGIVERKDFLGNTYDKVNHKNYIKTSLKEQTKIANFLSKIDEKIDTVSEQIEQTKE